MNCNPYYDYLTPSHGAIGGIQAGFAEHNICGSLIQQPANAISSVVYILVGIWILWRHRNSNPSKIYFVLFGLLGLGSFTLHSTATAIGQIADFVPIFLIISMFLYQAITNKRLKIWVPIGFVVTGIFTLLFSPIFRMAIVVVELIFLVLQETQNIITHKDKTTLWRAGWYLFIIAFLFWLSDEFRIFDFGQFEHYINAHVIWHILSSVSLGLVSNYFIKRKG
jgi:uncharacterized membrane protein